ncbi:MAG TPA: hypothetical protein GYA10_06970 [Alphaproteobacteria bacterium]|nr:hypothetical protein [Alphaproteobacteria bacterium]
MSFWKQSRQRSEELERAASHRRLAIDSARAVLREAHEAVFLKSARDPEFAESVADNLATTLLSVELHYLWGFFSAHSATEDFATHWVDRTQVLLMGWLVAERSYIPEHAKDETTAVRKHFNAATPAHDVISELGRRAYLSRDPEAFVRVVKWWSETARKAAK